MTHKEKIMAIADQLDQLGAPFVLCVDNGDGKTVHLIYNSHGDYEMQALGTMAKVIIHGDGMDSLLEDTIPALLRRIEANLDKEFAQQPLPTEVN